MWIVCFQLQNVYYFRIVLVLNKNKTLILKLNDGIKHKNGFTLKSYNC